MKGDDFYSPFEEVSLEGWNIGLTGNLTIPFLTIQTFIPVMKKQKKGSIINIASHYGIVGNDQRIYIGADIDKFYGTGDIKEKKQIYSHGVYNAAKGGLIIFSRYLAAYYGEYNIRVNCISPGGIYKENCENETFTKKYSEKVPLGRRANPDEMNGALIFLASDASSYVTGHNLVVDGGYTIW
jgi:NAD(P)-dependent dehydrogenase (short-subunit alcohol dehydrogenase family)